MAEINLVRADTAATGTVPVADGMGGYTWSVPASGSGGGVTAWQANTAYTQGQQLTYGGQLYAASTSFTTGSTFSMTNLVLVGLTAPTQTALDSTTKIATDQFVTNAVAAEASSRTTADALLATKASPTFTGTVTVPTPTTGDSSTKAASTAFVATAITAVSGGGGGGVTGEAALTPTALKSSGTYAASVGDMVLVDLSTANVTITLPSAPTDQARVGFTIVKYASPNTLTVNCAGSDQFTITGGGTTSTTPPVLYDAKIYQYQHSTALWIAWEGTQSRIQNDARYITAEQFVFGNLGAATTWTSTASNEQGTGTLTANCELTITSFQAGWSGVLLGNTGTGGFTLSIYDGSGSPQQVSLPPGANETFVVWMFSDDGANVTVVPGPQVGATGGGVPWDPSIVTTFDFRTNAAVGATLTANQARGGRVLITETGSLRDVAISIGTASGNISVAIYDVGATTSGVRTRLWTTGAIACPAAGNLTIVGDPALAVTAGEYLEFWMSVDNTTATFIRTPVGAIQLPSSYSAPDGVVAVFSPVQSSAHPCPSTLTTGVSTGGLLPLITARIS